MTSGGGGVGVVSLKIFRNDNFDDRLILICFA